MELLIYVFDIESAEPALDFKQFEEVMEALDQHSPDARVCVLLVMIFYYIFYCIYAC